MRDFEDEEDPFERNGAEPLTGSGLEQEQADGEFVANAEDETEGPTQ